MRLAEMIAVQFECAAWFRKFCRKACATAPPRRPLQEIIDLDLDAIAAVQPPRGYGRD